MSGINRRHHSPLSRRYPSRTSDVFPRKTLQPKPIKKSSSISNPPTLLSILNENTQPSPVTQLPATPANTPATMEKIQKKPPPPTSEDDTRPFQPPQPATKSRNSIIKQRILFSPAIINPATTTTKVSTMATPFTTPATRANMTLLPLLPTRARSTASSPEAKFDISATQLRAFLDTQKNGLELYNEHLKHMESILQRNSELEQRNKYLEGAIEAAKKEVEAAAGYKEWIEKMVGSANNALMGSSSVQGQAQSRVRFTQPEVGGMEVDKDEVIRELKKQLEEASRKFEGKDEMLDLAKDVLKVNRDLLGVKEKEPEEARGMGSPPSSPPEAGKRKREQPDGI